MSRLSEIKISTPTITETIPSLGIKVKMKPFRVADEKTLLMASESNDPDQIVSTLSNVIENCIDGDYKIEDLAAFDLEYLFLKLRAFSVGETSELLFACTECEHQNKVTVDISTVEVVKNEVEDIIRIDDSFGFKMKFSKLNDLAKAEENDSTDGYINLIANSIESVYYGDEIIEITKEEVPEMIRIVNELTAKHFEKVSNFINNQPKVVKETGFTCSECKAENKIKLEGLGNFF